MIIKNALGYIDLAVPLECLWLLGAGLSARSQRPMRRHP